MNKKSKIKEVKEVKELCMIGQNQKLRERVICEL